MLCATPARAADAVVAGNCTEIEFDAALTTVQNSGGGTISFACGGAKTITLTTPKSLTADLTLNGGGNITLSGGDTTRLFFVNGGVRFTTNDIALVDGYSAVGGGLVEATGAQLIFNRTRLAGSRADGQGGAIYCYVGTDGMLTLNTSIVAGNVSNRGGGIFNDGCAMTVQNSSILDNRASIESPLTLRAGGGIYNATNGSLQVLNSTFSGNDALDGGALFVQAAASASLSGSSVFSNSAGYGAGIENSGLLTVTDSVINANQALNVGGGLWNLGGRITLLRTTVQGNSAREGGGINSYGAHVELMDVNVVDNRAAGTDGGGVYHGGGTFFVTNATISNNYAAGNGGGIYQNSDDNLVLRNVTLSENQAAGFGGGIHHVAWFAVLYNVTMGNNSAAAGNALYEAADGSAGPGVLQLTNTVIFGSANNCDGGMFDSGGHNITAGSCSSLNAATDQTVVDARLGPLAFNSGAFLMQTHLPLAGSPVINGGDAAICSPADQRGAGRVGVCDVGAVEAGARLPWLYLPWVGR